MERNSFPSRITERERRSLIAGYIIRVVRQPDTSFHELAVADAHNVQWYDIEQAVSLANTNPQRFRPAERKDIAAYQCLRAIAFSFQRHLPSYDGENQLIRSESYPSEAAERVRNQHREVYARAARMLVTSHTDFTPGQLDNHLILRAISVCEPAAEPADTARLRLIQSRWNKHDAILGSRLDTRAKKVVMTETHPFENFVPYPVGKAERLNALVEDVRFFNQALS